MAFKKAIFRIDAQGSNSENSGTNFISLINYTEKFILHSNKHFSKLIRKPFDLYPVDKLVLEYIVELLGSKNQILLMTETF